MLPFTLPASVIGIILLLLLLACKIVKPAKLKDVSGFLLDNMALFFIPVVSSMMQYKDVLFANFWAIILICIGCAVVGLLVTVLIVIKKK